MTTAPADTYTRRARLDRLVDGDTLDLVVDLGFDVTWAGRVRLLGVDTPETRTRDLDEKERGNAATSYANAWMVHAGMVCPDPGWPLILRTRIDGGRGKYGRILGRVWNTVGAELGADLVDNGHARIYLPR